MKYGNIFRFIQALKNYFITRKNHESDLLNFNLAETRTHTDLHGSAKKSEFIRR